MTTTPTYWTSVAVRLAEDAYENGTLVARKGDVVLVQGFIWDNRTWVNGIARPTYQSGGVHVDTARVASTGKVLMRAIVSGAYVASGDVIRSMLGMR